MTKTNSTPKISFKRSTDKRGWSEYYFENKNGSTCEIKMVYGICDFWTVFMNGCQKYETSKLSDARNWAKDEIVSRGWVK